jgi:hypothetical protein
MPLRVASALVVLLSASCSPIAAEDDPTQEALCVEGSVTAILQVDLDDPRVIWAINGPTAQTLDLRIPGGYGVTEDDEIVDPDGRVIATTGDTIVSGCADIVQGALWISEHDIERRPAN